MLTDILLEDFGHPDNSRLLLATDLDGRDAFSFFETDVRIIIEISYTLMYSDIDKWSAGYDECLIKALPSNCGNSALTFALLLNRACTLLFWEVIDTGGVGNSLI